MADIVLPTLDYAILQPIVALMIWTMIMWAWMYATRLPAMSRLKVPNAEMEQGNTARVLDDKLPASVQRKAHNYNHLHEQPTVFYAAAILLALIPTAGDVDALLCWIYVGLRVAHSIIQVTANKVIARFILFALSSVVLIALIVHAAILVFDIG